MDPTPRQLLALQTERIERARHMSPEQKLAAGPQLFEIALEAMRSGIRLQRPQATPAEIETQVRLRLNHMRQKDERALHGLR